MSDLEVRFIERFGEELYRSLIGRAGCHSDEEAPAEGPERLVFALLEAIDFECPKYGDLDGISMEDMKSFLVSERDTVRSLRVPPPSYIGLLSGAFSFLEGGEMSWASELSDLTMLLWEEGQRKQRIVAEREGEALRHDLSRLCLECWSCLVYFNARWPHLVMNHAFVRAMRRN